MPLSLFADVLLPNHSQTEPPRGYYHETVTEEDNAKEEPR